MKSLHEVDKEIYLPITEEEKLAIAAIKTNYPAYTFRVIITGISYNLQLKNGDYSWDDLTPGITQEWSKDTYDRDEFDPAWVEIIVR